MTLLILTYQFHRIEQTATLRVDNGPIATGASPGKLRQLNGNGQLFVGKIFGADFALSENVKDKSSGLYPVLP